MKYRVLKSFKSYPFSSYEEAKVFTNANGGVIYRLEYSCYYE